MIQQTSTSIEVINVKKKLGNTQSLNDVSLHFESGKMHGIIGPEGAGKTTLLRVILGLLTPNSGKVCIKEEKNILSLADIRNKVTYMPQQQSLYPDLSIDEHLEFFRALYQINQKDYIERRKMLLSLTRLTPYIDRPAGALSGGMYKKLGLMCALLRSPEILLLDEPTNGVDPISRREFWNLLYQLIDRSILILMTTSYMDEAERCSKVHLMNAGTVVDAGEPRSLLSKYQVDSFDALFLTQGNEEI
jgi:ABC-2 type transport system ATP-binding protein